MLYDFLLNNKPIKKMKLYKITTVQGLDFYKGRDKIENRPIYNIVPKGHMPPRDGFFSPEYVAKEHNTSAQHFFRNE